MKLLTKSGLVLLLITLLLSSFVLAQTQEDTCGFWCTIDKVLWGDKEARAGKAWWDRGALVGQAVTPPEPAAKIGPSLIVDKEGTVWKRQEGGTQKDKYGHCISGACVYATLLQSGSLFPDHKTASATDQFEGIFNKRVPTKYDPKKDAQVLLINKESTTTYQIHYVQKKDTILSDAKFPYVVDRWQEAHDGSGVSYKINAAGFWFKRDKSGKVTEVSGTPPLAALVPIGSGIAVSTAKTTTQQTNTKSTQVTTSTSSSSSITIKSFSTSSGTMIQYTLPNGAVYLKDAQGNWIYKTSASAGTSTNLGKTAPKILTDNYDLTTGKLKTGKTAPVAFTQKIIPVTTTKKTTTPAAPKIPAGAIVAESIAPGFKGKKFTITKETLAAAKYLGLKESDFAIKNQGKDSALQSLQEQWIEDNCKPMTKCLTDATCIGSVMGGRCQALGRLGPVTIREILVTANKKRELELKQVLGNDYRALRQQIDLNTITTESAKKYTLKNGGSVTVTKNGDKVTLKIDQFTSKKQPDPKTSQTVIYQKGIETFRQTDANIALGKARIDQQDVYTEDKNLRANFESGKQVVFYQHAAGKAKGEVAGTAQKNAAGNIVIANFRNNQETIRSIVDGSQEQNLISTFTKDDAGCSPGVAKFCYISHGGKTFDKTGKVQLELRRNYHTQRAANGEVERTEYYDVRTGRMEKVEYEVDGDKVVIQAQKSGATYTGNYEVTVGSAKVTLKKVGGVWQGAGTCESACQGLVRQLNECTATNCNANIKKLKNNLDGPTGVRSSTTGGLAQAQTALESIYAVTDSVRSYSGFSRLIDLGFSEAGSDAWRQYQSGVDQAFAPFLGKEWFFSPICEANFQADITPEGVSVIKTPTGTYQAVASIQIERSKQETPILCYQPTDEEGNLEEPQCDEGNVCYEDFCYRKNDTSFEKPVEGFFYKITWGVAAPRDEGLTPFADESAAGHAVSFNVWVDQDDNGQVDQGAIPLYKSGLEIAGALGLKNGDNTKDVFIKYSNLPIKEACIKWDKAPLTNLLTIGGRVPDICFPIDEDGADTGKIKWETAARQVESKKPQNSDVQKNRNWG